MAVNTASNAKLEYEAGQTYQAYTTLTDSGDQQIFESDAALWSDKSGKGPTIRPNGLVTGCAVSVGTGNNNVNVAGGTAYLAGVLTEITADTSNAVTRPTTTDYCLITSIIITAAGAVDVEPGLEGAAIVEARGEAGGPPWIPTGAIEIAQVRVTDDADAVITADEIFSVVGTHCERYDFPVWDEKYAENDDSDYAHVKFISALPLIHSDNSGTAKAAKKIYATWYEPDFAEIGTVSDFVPAETTNSVTSTSVYGGAIGAASSSIQQGSFTAYLSDGIADNIVTEKGNKLWFRFYPDRLRSNYLLTQGILGINRTFPADNNIQASCTITATTESIEVAS